jgi:hypothetical protein
MYKEVEVWRAAVGAVLWVLVCVVLMAAAASAPQGDDEVEACVRRNLPEKTSVQTVQFRSIDRTGSERTVGGKLYWKRFPDGFSGTLIRIEAPPDVRGSAYLIRERKSGDDSFVYLPERRNVHRISSEAISGSLFGTDFTYEDFRYLQKMAGQLGAKRLPDARVGQRAVFVLQALLPPKGGSAYQRVVFFVDQTTCVPLKIEFYEPGDRLRKVLKVDPGAISRESDLWVARSLTLRDLRDGTETRLVFEEIEVDVGLSDRLFSEATLGRGH